MNKYTINASQVNVIGDNAEVQNTQQIFNHNISQEFDTKDLSYIAEELSKFRQKICEETSIDETSISEIRLAEDGARKGNLPTVLYHLKNVGASVYDTAIRLSADIVASLIKKSLEIK